MNGPYPDDGFPPSLLDPPPPDYRYEWVTYLNRWEAEVLREFLGGKLPHNWEVYPDPPPATIEIRPETRRRCEAMAAARKGPGLLWPAGHP